MDVTGDIGAEAVSGFVDDLQAAGRYSFTRADLRQSLTKSEVALDRALARLKKRGRVVAPRRGFYVTVPTEYRSAGAPPPSWYIDDLMGFLGQPYYVGLLSAAAVHGASHQQAMAFQVVTDRPTRWASVGRTRIEFHMSSSVGETPATPVQTETGTMRLSTPEATALDLVRFARACGGWSAVATVLAELAERLDPEALYVVGAVRKTPEVQRLGYLLDWAAFPRLADPLLRVLSAKRYRPVPLAPDAPVGAAQAVSPWRVIPNEPAELDA